MTENQKVYVARVRSRAPGMVTFDCYESEDQVYELVDNPSENEFFTVKFVVSPFKGK